MACRYIYKGKTYESREDFVNNVLILELGVRTISKNDESTDNFLQILNTDNAWVHFFVQSIIQDSINRGYEKIHFPSGNTAAKVEGHMTVSTYIAEKEARIAKLKNILAEEDAKGTYSSGNIEVFVQEGFDGIDENGNEIVYKDSYYMHGIEDKLTRREALVAGVERITKEKYEEIKKQSQEKYYREMEQFQAELDNARNGINTFGAIANFYENDVQNILKKKGYEPTRITDEHGNDWFEIVSKPNYKETIFFNREIDNTSTDFLVNQGLAEEHEGKYIIPSKDQLHKVEQYNEDYYQKNGVRPFVITPLSNGAFEVEARRDVNKIGTSVASKSTTMVASILSRLQNVLGVEGKVVSEAAAKELLGKRYNGEPAFFYKGAVYLIADKLSVNSTIHEFAHPLIMGLRVNNRAIYDNIFKELEDSLDPNVLQVFDEVKTLYPEYSKTDNAFKDEVIVRVLAGVAKNKIEKKGLKTFLERVWFRLKELFRKLFGDKIAVSKLNESTTIEDLADMLAFGTDFIETGALDDELFFNRELATQLTGLGKQDQLIQHIEEHKDILKTHIKYLKDHNHAKLREVLKNDHDGSIPQDLASQLRNADKLKVSDNIEDEAERLIQQVDIDFKKMRAFAEAIIGIKDMSQKMAAHVADLEGKVPEQELLRTLFYYSRMVADWENLLDSLAGTTGHEGKLGEYIAQATTAFKQIHAVSKRVWDKGVTDLLVEQLTPIKEEADAMYKDRIEQLKAKIAAGETNAKPLLEKLEKFYKKFNLDRETIVEYLHGNMGDTNAFSAMLESYTSSPDPIVGGFAVFMKKNFMKVEGHVNEISTRLRFELKDAYNTLGVTRRDPEDFGSQLVSVVQIPGKNDKGEIIAHEVYAFMNEFHGSWLYDYKTLEQAFDTANKSGDKEAIKKARKEFEDLKRNFFHREYKDEVYKASEFWDENDINKEAQRQRDLILNKIRVLEGSIDVTNLEAHEEDIEEIESLQEEQRWLRSLTYKDGTPKQGEDLAVAEALQEYSRRTKGLYKEFEIKGLFAQQLKTFKGDIEQKGIAEGSDEFKRRVNEWVRANIRIKLSQEFYDSRQGILDEIESIIAKLPKEEANNLSISAKWKEIFTTIKENRDDDGQPIGSDLNPEQLQKVYELQEEIDDIRGTLVRMSGLTSEEDTWMGDFLMSLNARKERPPADHQRYEELMSKMQTVGLSAADRGRLSLLFGQLRAFQTKIPTEYYVDVFNEMAERHGVKRRMSVLTADSMMDEIAMGEIMSEGTIEFRNWFTANHRLVNRWDNEIKQSVNKWERLYVWNRIIPNDEDVINAFDKQDYEALMAINNPYFEIKKARKFYFYRIKDEHRTGYDEATGKVKLKVGEHKDNRGNWLPRTDVLTSKYLNQEYFRLRDSKDTKDKALFSAIETYKKHHLKLQENAPNYTRLWYEIPRVEKHRTEVINQALDNPTGFFKNVWFSVKGSFTKLANAFDRGDASPADIRNETKKYVMTDLFGNELQAIPMKFMSKIEKDNVSLDIFRSMMMYASAIENNKMLHEINPMARALENIVAENGIKDINKMSWFSSLNNAFSKGVKAKDNVRLRALRNMFERDIEGISSKMELGFFGHKVSQHLMGLAAFGSLAMNIPAGIKNLFSARIQNVLETVTGKNFTAKDWGLASRRFLTDVLPALTKDYNSFGEKSVYTQMYELFDPVEGKYLEHLGKEGTQSYVRDIATMQFLSAPQTFGEINAQGTGWLAMMNKTKVEQTTNGETKLIPYVEAWEKNSEGVLVLKQGIDPAWDRGGEKFLSFKTRMHKVNELLQGAYATLNQPELARYTLGKLALFMRRFVGPGAVNHFAPTRMNAALGTIRGGHITSATSILWDSAKSFGKNWALYNDDEKRQVWKSLIQMGYSVMFLLLLLGLGYDDNDKHKSKKVAGYDWQHQMLIYELLMIKSEAETFIPLPGMGVNELLRMKDNFSIAMPIMNRYKKLFDSFLYWVGGKFSDEYAEKARYQKDQGVWEKGDLKATAQLLKFFGWTGNTQHPDVAIKNYSMSMSRY